MIYIYKFNFYIFDKKIIKKPITEIKNKIIKKNDPTTKSSKLEFISSDRI
jgi:hypothetical protein